MGFTVAVMAFNVTAGSKTVTVTVVFSEAVQMVPSAAVTATVTVTL